MEQMQCAIETESKSKAEAMRMRKKLEMDINELESALNHANLANAELQKSVRLYQVTLLEHNYYLFKNVFNDYYLLNYLTLSELQGHLFFRIIL
jgi:hypothetical protein